MSSAKCCWFRLGLNVLNRVELSVISYEVALLLYHCKVLWLCVWLYCFIVSVFMNLTIFNWFSICIRIRICAYAQFKINTHRCWNWHLCIPDGLSVVQCSLGHAIGVVFLTQLQWHEANVLDNWQLAELPQCGGREFDPRRVHNNLSVPLWVYISLCQNIKIKPTNMYVVKHVLLVC